MEEKEYHQMDLIGEDGEAEIWACHICGRKYRITWPPSYTKEVLEEGNTERTIHVVDSRNDESENLGTWLEWIETSNFERLWNE